MDDLDNIVGKKRKRNVIFFTKIKCQNSCSSRRVEDQWRLIWTIMIKLIHWR